MGFIFNVVYKGKKMKRISIGSDLHPNNILILFCSKPKFKKIIPYNSIKSIILKENDGDPRECKIVSSSGTPILTFSSLTMRNFFLAHLYSSLVTQFIYFQFQYLFLIK